MYLIKVKGSKDVTDFVEIRDDDFFVTEIVKMPFVEKRIKEFIGSDYEKIFKMLENEDFGKIFKI